jgi:hypothetical protein
MTNSKPQSRFAKPLRTEFIDGRRSKLLSELTFASSSLDRVICVPVGFETDFASVPRIFWSIIPPTGSYSPAAVIHDFLYRTKNIASRKQADAVMYEALVDLHIAWWLRQLIYWGLWIGGRFAYKGSRWVGFHKRTSSGDGPAGLPAKVDPTFGLPGDDDFEPLPPDLDRYLREPEPQWWQFWR